MPKFRIESEDGRTITLEGDNAPSPDEIDEIFQSVPARQKVELLNDSVRNIPSISDTTVGGPKTSISTAPIRQFRSDVADTIPEFWQNINTPTVELANPLTPEEKQKINQQGTTAHKIAGGAYDSLANTANFFTSPLGITTLGMGALPKIAQRVVAGLFAAQMASQVPELATELGTELGKPENERDIQRISELTTSAATATGFTALAGLHATRPTPLHEKLAAMIDESPIVSKMTPDEIAASRLGLPGRVKQEALPELERTRSLIDQAIQEATQKIETPGPKAIDLLKAQDAEIVPEPRKLAERPGGGEATGGKVSFNQSAESLIGKEKNLPDWAREEMQRSGIPTDRTFNDIDLGNKSVRDAIESDPTLTEPQKKNLLEKGTNQPAESGKVAPKEEVNMELQNALAKANRKGATLDEILTAKDLLEKEAKKKSMVFQATGKEDAALEIGLRSDALFGLKYDEWNALWKDLDAAHKLAEKAYDDGKLKVSGNPTMGEIWSEYMKQNPSIASDIRRKHGLDGGESGNAASYFDRESEMGGFGRMSTRPTVEDVRRQRAQESKPEVAKVPEPNGYNKSKNNFGDPSGTTYHATPEDWAAWQEVQKQPVMESFAERERIKNKYGGMPPEAPKESSAQPRQGTSPQLSSLLEGEQAKAAETPAAVSVSKVESVPSTENGGRIAIVLPNGKAVVGGRFHADTWNRAVDKGIATDSELMNGFAGYVRPDGTAWGVNGKLLPKVQEVFLVGSEIPKEAAKPRPVQPDGPIQSAISAIESAQKNLRGNRGKLLMGVPKAALDLALESVRISLKAGKSIAEAIETAMRKVRYNFSNFNERALRAELDRIIHEESKSAAGRPATGSRPSAGGVSGQPRVEGAAFEQQKSGTSLDDVYKIFEPAPKPKGPSLKQRGVNIIESLRTGISSKFRPINKLAENIAKAYGLKKPKDIAGIMEQLKGSQGRGEAEVYRFDRDVSELVKGKEQDFNAYLFLRRSIDRLEQDVKDITRAFAGEEVPILNRRSVAGFTINSLKPRLQALEAKVGPETMAKFQEAAQKYQDYMDGALKLQVESGRMSPEIYKAIKDGNQFYAPFKVMKYIEDQMRPEGSGRKIDTVADFTKAMSGITDPNFKLGDMLASARQSLLMSRILADKNTAMQHLTELAGWDVDGRFVKRLKSGEDAPSGMEAVNVLEHGKQVRYAVDSKVAQALQLYGNTGKGVISRALGLAGVPFRAGATMLNIPFQVSNLMADVPRQALVSRYGLSGVQDMVRYPLNFVHSLMTSMQADVLGNRNPVLMAAGKVIPPIEKLRQANEKLYLDFLDSGVAGTTIQSYLTPEALKFKEPTAVSKSRKLAGSVLSTIPNFANAIEQTSKILGVKRAMRTHGVESGAELAKKVPEAVTEIRRYSGSPDFGRQGTWIENARLNLLYMFFNARLQGTIADVGRLAGRTGGKDAARMWIRIVSAVGIPTAYLYYLNHHKDNEADFMQRSEQERQNYWLIPKEDAEGKPRYITTEQGEKVRDYWRIPKRESSKWVANLVESALDFSKQKDSKAAEAFGAQMLQEISPVNIQGDTAQERLESAASSLNPLIKAPLELATGRDFYRHRNVIPENLKDVSPEEQYTPRTAELFKTVADKIPDVAPEVLRSPIVLEQMTKNLTAGLLTQFLPRPEVSGRSKLENQPLLQRFQSTPIVDTKNFQDEVQGLKRQAADERIARQRAVDKILKDNPKIESKDLYEKVPQQYKQDERFVRQLVDTWVAQKNGITVQERMLLSLPTKERAEWVAKQLNGKSPQEKSALIIEYAKKRILTEAVYAQLPEFLEKK